MGQAALLSDKTIKRCKDVITIKVRMAFAFGGTEENMTRAGYVKALCGVAGQMLFLSGGMVI